MRCKPSLEPSLEMRRGSWGGTMVVLKGPDRQGKPYSKEEAVCPPTWSWSTGPTLSDTLPDQVGSLLFALHQYRVRAQRQPVSPKFEQAFLVSTDPVGK